VDRQVVEATRAKAVDARVDPKVRPMPTVLTETEVVLVWRLPVLEHENELELRTIERPLSGVRLRPHNQVLQFGIGLLAGAQHFGQATPVHEHEMDRPIGGMLSRE
jgi:hypothetical protein